MLAKLWGVTDPCFVFGRATDDAGSDLSLRPNSLDEIP
jgi:hypothetical protein